MAMTKLNKKEIIEKLTNNPNNTGSSSVQIGLLTERINYLTKHLTQNPKDNSAKRGLSLLISQRKRLLNYLSKHDNEEYKKVIKQLGLRK